MRTAHLISIHLDLDPDRRVEILGLIDATLRQSHALGWTGEDVEVVMYHVEPSSGWTSPLGWL